MSIPAAAKQEHSTPFLQHNIGGWFGAVFKWACHLIPTQASALTAQFKSYAASLAQAMRRAETPIRNGPRALTT
jgi:hypothetical protein